MNKEKTTNQPSHRPLREGEIIQEGDEWRYSVTFDGGVHADWAPVVGSVGQAYDPSNHYPMRRPAGKG